MVTRIKMIPAESRKMMRILAIGIGIEEFGKYYEQKTAYLVLNGERYYEPYSLMSREQLSRLLYERSQNMSDKEFRKRAYSILAGTS